LFYAANVIPLDGISYTAAALSSLIILTTGWAQDFADQEGDRQQGNITVPILAPKASRVLFPIALILWGMALIAIWEQDLSVSIPFLLLTAIAGVRFCVFRTTKEDEMSYLLYNVSLINLHFRLIHALGTLTRGADFFLQVWLTVLHLLPAARRTHLETISRTDFTRLFQRKMY
jgi:hypothetical protein